MKMTEKQEQDAQAIQEKMAEWQKVRTVDISLPLTILYLIY